MRASDGTIVEVFEWMSQEPIASAHNNPVVLGLWKRFEAVRSYEIDSNVSDSTRCSVTSNLSEVFGVRYTIKKT
jgi:hypothetical protein